MRKQRLIVARPVKMLFNTTDSRKNQWGKIVDARTQQVLHIGSVAYIKRIARKKYNATA